MRARSSRRMCRRATRTTRLPYSAAAAGRVRYSIVLFAQYTKQSDQEPMSANQKTLEEQDESNMRKHRASINAWAKAWNDHRNNPANTPSAGMPPRPPVLVSDKYKPKSSRPRREDLSTRALLVRALLEELD
ncbi:uncharacterized protein FIBRA_03627 [Fibroporia radiculosa]|uniref:Uncharacterized protein n=1 Tax=Fibroporia radiculosa TaxID=599839 RepID=J4HW34_9APHY|nr:uncharacterized protein FIBRA_03627 [Fibroporia radiculosa]CCM01567.1 predicted protein [Fibroporia radiculosa]